MLLVCDEIIGEMMRTCLIIECVCVDRVCSVQFIPG